MSKDDKQLLAFFEKSIWKVLKKEEKNLPFKLSRYKKYIHRSAENMFVAFYTSNIFKKVRGYGR